MDQAEIVDQLALSDDGSSSEEELCMDIGEPDLNSKNEDKNDLNDIWTKSMKVINSIEDLINDANQATGFLISKLA